ncbi:MAG: hypothetical protein PWQ46_1073 [Methanomicrobiaceae archaeon]|nr:hypothetical protein [Methanomicrobiaceae archaeon]
MHRRYNTLLLVLLAVAAIAGGCMMPDEESAEMQPTPPATAPPADERQAAGGSLPAPTPPVPTPGEEVPQSLGFVDPATYRIPTPTPMPTMMRPPDDVRVSEKMVEYAVVSCDYPPRLLATEVYHIPFPYWAVEISTTPMNDYPWLRIEIRDANDPNRVVEEIRYSKGELLSSIYVDTDTTEDDEARKAETLTIREGYDDYYFIIRSESLETLDIRILVPEKYLV